jgi:hypothetical protein
MIRIEHLWLLAAILLTISVVIRYETMPADQKIFSLVAAGLAAMIYGYRSSLRKRK